mmetsp:Transcript_20731/g.47391  ORF Transcript_20731/g.47391 Transcript_20731/m.47391 type:complete len:97 (-) Transcript_20731:50-340(-)
MLAPRFQAVVLPQLSIQADQVACSHGAAVSTVDKSMMFYLRSRGLDAAVAARLLALGSCREVLERIPTTARMQLEAGIDQAARALQAGKAQDGGVE